MIKKTAENAGVKRRIEGYTEVIELKMIECSSCGSGYILYDSRDTDRITRLSPTMKKAREQLVSEHTKLEGAPCKCGKGIYSLLHNKWEKEHKGYTVVTCDCGKEIECHHFTNTCNCGADYNHSGQRLATRRQWGEETNEHWMDCY